MSSQAWIDATRKILDALDLRAEYVALGVKLAGNEPNGSGWIKCHCVGRDDHNPSAGVCVEGEHPMRGRYKEFTGEARCLSFFEFAAAAGKFPDWQEARRFYAKQVGVKLPRGPKPATVEDKLAPRDWNEALVRSWCLHKPPIAHWAVRIAGGKLAAWPAKSQRYAVVALPVYGSQGVYEDPIGYTIWNKTGQTLPLFQGKGTPPRQEKMLSVGGSKAGWMNRYALARLEDAEIVWKVEGPADMLALQSVIPKEHLAKHVVLTNSNGTMELPREDYVAMLAGKIVYVLHDCDKDGQVGGRRWATAIATVASVCRFVRLPYEVAEKHGKDLRDWLNEGHSYADLLYLATSAEPVPGRPAPNGPASPTASTSATAASDATLEEVDPHDPLASDKILLEELKLDVLGEREDRKIEVFSEMMGKSDVIPQVSKLHYEDLLQICGPVVRVKVNQSLEPVVGMYHIDQVKQAIAVMAGQRRITDATTRGQGIWLGTSDEIVLVGAGEAAVWTGGKELHRVRRPRAGGLLLDISSSSQWYCFSKLNDLLRSCNQPWAASTISEAIQLFDRWYWKRGERTSELIAALVLATWVQTIWEWRPLVSIIGESSCGKSSLFETLSTLFGGLGLLAAKSTEAGLRQAIRNKACAILIDEFESDSHRQRILDLLRTSGKGSRQLRGTTDQRGVEYGLKHICWVTAVEVGLEREPDRNRFITLELDLPPKDKHGQLELPSRTQIEDLGLRMLAVSVYYANEARRMAAAIRKHQYPGVHARVVESFSVPIAFLVCCLGEASEDVAHRLAEDFFGAFNRDTASPMSDQVDCLHTVLASQVFLGGGQQATVSQLLSRPEDFTNPWDSLGRVGIAAAAKHRGRRPESNSWDREYLFLACDQVRRFLLKGTKFESQTIQQMLGRLPGAEPSQRVVAGKRAWGVLIPWNYLQTEFFATEEASDVF